MHKGILFYSSTVLSVVSVLAWGTTTFASDSDAEKAKEISEAKKTAGQTPEEASSRLQKVFDAAQADKIVGKWLDERINSKIKHGLDRQIDLYLKNHPMVQEARPYFIDALKEYAGTYRAFLTSRAGKAMADTPNFKGQYQKELAMAQDVAKRLNFTERARNDLALFVLPTADINAFTYSGVPNRFIDLVLFEGIRDLLTETELKAVIGHEIGHIKAQHVLNQQLVIAIFLATGQNIIPEERYAEAKDAFHQGVKEQLRKMVDHGRISELKKSDPAFAEFQEKRLNGMFELALEQAEMLQKRFGNDQLKDLAAELGNMIEGRNLEGSGKKAIEGGELSFFGLQEFIRSLERYSRSCEVSSDRYGMIATNLGDAAMVDVKLAGGKEATLDGVMKQVDLLDEAFRKYNGLRDTIRESQRTHPAPVMRVLQLMKFEKSPAYQIYSNPLYKGLDTYMGLAEIVHEAEMQTREPYEEAREPIDTLGRDRHIQNFQEVETQLRKVLVREVTDGFKGAEANIQNFESLVKYLEFVQNHGFEITERASSPKGLLAEVAAELSKLAKNGNKAAEFAHDLLRDNFLPYDYELVLDRNGRTKIRQRSRVEESMDRLREMAEKKASREVTKERTRRQVRKMK